MLKDILEMIYKDPESVEFDMIMQAIDENYTYTPARFSNGCTAQPVINEAGSNEGSCKIFSFAQLHQLTTEQTLHCFGKYYRDEVLNHPEDDNHANIRAFMEDGWAGIQFDQPALQIKEI